MIRLVIGVVAVCAALAHAQNQTTLLPYGNDGLAPSAIPMATGQDECTQELRRCLGPLMAETGNVTLGGPETWTASQLRARCSLLTRAEMCVQESPVQCQKAVEMQSQVFFQMTNFICHDVFDELLRLSSCVGSPQTQGDVQQCVQGIMQAQAALLHSDTGMDETAAQCSIITDYEECVLEVEGTDCGQEAQRLYLRIFDRMNQLITKEINCTSVAEGSDPDPELLIPGNEEECAAVTSSCLETLEPYRASMTDFNMTNLPQACTAFGVSKTCMDTKAAECEASLVEWQILEQSFSVMCNPSTLQVLREGAACFTKPSAVAQLNNCGRSELQNEQEVEEERTCQVLKEYLSCYDAVLESECPAPVSEAMEDVLEEVAGIIQLELQVDCDDEEEDKPEVGGDSGEEDDETKTVELSEEKCAEVIAGCLEPLEPHRKGFTSFQLETIPQVCSDFSLVQTCVTETAHVCEDTPEWTIIEDSFTRICQPAVTEEVSECPTRSDVVTKLRSCEKDELKVTEQLEERRTCEVIEEYVNCYSITVKQQCEERDGELVSQVMTGVAQVIQLDKEVACVDLEDNEKEEEEEDGQTPEDEETDMISDIDERLEETWGALSPCMEQLADIHISALPVHRYESLDELCMHFDEAKICGSEVVDSVSEEIRGLWNQLMVTEDYLCHEKRQEFSEVYSCLVTKMAGNNLQQDCYQPISEPYSDSEDNSLCRMVEDFEKCSTRMVRMSCGAVAGRLMKGLLEKMNNLLDKESHIDCPLTSAHAHRRTAIALGISAGGLVLVIAIAIALICRRRRRAAHSLDKKALVKNDVLQTNIQIGLEGEKKGKDGEVATLSVSQLHM